MRAPTVDRPVIFFRSGVACALSVTEAGVFWGHIGVDNSSNSYGSRFVTVGATRLFKVLFVTGNQALASRWWLGFEGTRAYSLPATMDELKRAADLMVTQGIDEAS